MCGNLFQDFIFPEYRKLNIFKISKYYSWTVRLEIRYPTDVDWQTPYGLSMSHAMFHDYDTAVHCIIPIDPPISQCFIVAFVYEDINGLHY